MTAIAQALSRVFLSTSHKLDDVKQIGLFCAVGLLVSVLQMIDGVDSSPGFF
jgi:hypothetical protein